MENQGEIILYQPDKEVRLEVRLENETVWLSIDEMSQLFGRDISVIGKHIRNIFKEGELVKDSVWAKFAYTASDGKIYQVDYYNLDVIISVGYRVKSQRGTQFRQWANKVLKEYLLKGYSINQRLKDLEEKVDAKFVQHERQLNLDIQKHNSQYSRIEVKTYKQCHDRFLIIDDTDVYHIGASLKDLGKKMFAFSKLDIPSKAITDLL